MKALIVGGGVAGPATALALHHVGIESIVLEAWPRSDGESGSWFAIAPNGLHALDLLGLLEVAKEFGVPSETSAMYGANGRLLGRVTLGAPLADGTVALTMKRSRLALALVTEAEARGIEVRHEARVVSVNEDADGVTVTLSDGEQVRGDLLIGADGVHSIVRSTIDPSAPSARYVGLTNFGGITRSTSVAQSLEPRVWHFIFGSRAFFGAQLTPAGDVVWFVNAPRPAISAKERAETTTEQWRARLLDLVKDDVGPASELIRTGQFELVADNTHDLGHVPHWHRGRMVVIGDAAHAPSPSSGQGGSMALEDAIVLATSLRDSDSVEAGLAAFESARRERVEKIVRTGARSSSAKIPGRAGRAFRDAAMRLIFRYVVTDRSMEWMTGHRVGWGPTTLSRTKR